MKKECIMSSPIISRRLWLQSAGVAVASTQIIHAAELRSLEVEIVETKVISYESDHYHGWPTVARDAEGKIYLAYSGGRRAHVCPFGRVELMTSHDDGTSWSWPQVVFDGPIDDRDAGVCVTAKGTVLVSTFTSLAYVAALKKMSAKPEEYAVWQAVHDRLNDQQRQSQLGCWMMRSEDQGASFSAPARVPLNSPHGPIQLSDGRLMYAGKTLWDQPSIVGVSFSEDDGKNWSKPEELPVRPGDDPAHYHELHGVEADNGDLLIHIRNHNPENNQETLQCVSRDGGKTWSQPDAINVWGLPSHLTRMRDGRLLMSYGYRRKPYGNLVRFSADHGASWSEPKTISSDGVGGDLGYPSTVQLGDDRFLTVWYERLAESTNAVVRQSIWRLVG
jgi:sialidase-1